MTTEVTYVFEVTQTEKKKEAFNDDVTAEQIRRVAKAKETEVRRQLTVHSTVTLVRTEIHFSGVELAEDDTE